MRLVRAVLILLVLFSVNDAAPSGSKEFHEHLEDFVGLIIAESGLQLERLLKQYGENQDFGIAVTYLRTTDFKELLNELESLPEFKVVVDYLENSHIDITHILNRVDDLVDSNEKSWHKTYKLKEGEMASSSFIRESISLFPKEKLAALFEQKQSESSTFKEAIDRLHTKEWKKLYGELWKCSDFQKAVSTLAENGLDVRLFVEHIEATFGQN